jgi:hypothetical protein
MSRRRDHYEAAFEDYLRSVGRPYVAVDDAKRAVFSGAQVKSFDFLVYSEGPTHWLVDVKGRKLALRSTSQKGHLENWTTRDDLAGLDQWAAVFGEGFAGLLVFAYWLTEPRFGVPLDGAFHSFRERSYIFTAIPVSDYSRLHRPRSRRWATVSVPAASFREAIRTIEDFL